MQYTDFEIGLEFECGEKRWRCTDLGTRTVIAIALEYAEDPSWYNGPPYAVAETVFDEYEGKTRNGNLRTPRYQRVAPGTKRLLSQ